MNAVLAPAPTSDLRPVPAGFMLLCCFVVSLFASAFLLFSVQPLVSRLVLPRLGGFPAVWNTCICFFPAALLLGHLYAHIVSTRLRMRNQAALHAVALFAALATMPLSLGSDAPVPDASLTAWLFVLLASAVGLPFVAVAATAPLLQSWFARTTHPAAHDPYFLYASSNAGSLVALLSYPTLIEAFLGLPEQSLFWSAGLALTAAAVMLCGVAALLRAASPVPPAALLAAPLPIAPGERVRWVLLAFVPSALMLAATTHITTDIASVPLLWVIPLAIYILTFILAFAQNRLSAIERCSLSRSALHRRFRCVHHPGAHCPEPRRVCRRLQLLRGWSDDDEEGCGELLAGGAGAGDAFGAGGWWRSPDAMGGHQLGVGQERLHGGDAAQVGAPCRA